MPWFPAMESPYLTAVEVATLLRVDPNTVRRWCNEGQLPCVRAGSAIRIAREAFEAFVAQGGKRR